MLARLVTAVVCMLTPLKALLTVLSVLMVPMLLVRVDVRPSTEMELTMVIIMALIMVTLLVVVSVLTVIGLAFVAPVISVFILTLLMQVAVGHALRELIVMQLELLFVLLVLWVHLNIIWAPHIVPLVCKVFIVIVRALLNVLLVCLAPILILALLLVLYVLLVLSTLGGEIRLVNPVMATKFPMSTVLAVKALVLALKASILI